MTERSVSPEITVSNQFPQNSTIQNSSASVVSIGDTFENMSEFAVPPSFPQTLEAPPSSNSNDTNYSYSPSTEYVTELTGNDVLCGRGSGPNDHIGNIHFRNIVANRKTEYLSTNKRKDKDRVARQIVRHVRMEVKPAGRFLKKVDANLARDIGFSRGQEVWMEVNMETALEKVKQALRQNRNGNDNVAITNTGPKSISMPKEVKSTESGLTLDSPRDNLEEKQKWDSRQFHHRPSVGLPMTDTNNQGRVSNLNHFSDNANMPPPQANIPHSMISNYCPSQSTDLHRNMQTNLSQHHQQAIYPEAATSHSIENNMRNLNYDNSYNASPPELWQRHRGENFASHHEDVSNTNDHPSYKGARENDYPPRAPNAAEVTEDDYLYPNVDPFEPTPISLHLSQKMVNNLAKSNSVDPILRNSFLTQQYSRLRELEQTKQNGRRAANHLESVKEGEVELSLNFQELVADYEKYHGKRATNAITNDSRDSSTEGSSRFVGDPLPISTNLSSLGYSSTDEKVLTALQLSDKSSFESMMYMHGVDKIRKESAIENEKLSPDNVKNHLTSSGVSNLSMKSYSENKGNKSYSNKSSSSGQSEYGINSSVLSSAISDMSMSLSEMSLRQSANDRLFNEGIVHEVDRQDPFSGARMQLDSSERKSNLSKSNTTMGTFDLQVAGYDELSLMPSITMPNDELLLERNSSLENARRLELSDSAEEADLQGRNGKQNS